MINCMRGHIYIYIYGNIKQVNLDKERNIPMQKRAKGVDRLINELFNRSLRAYKCAFR